MLSQTVEYALRAMVYLAGQDGPRTTEQVATTTRVPPAYLSKVLQGLVRAELVRSRRGLGGGMTLTKPAEELTILEVVNAVEPIGRIRSCPLGLTSHGVRLCPLHRRLDDALAAVELAFGSTTLAEILADPSPSVPLCDFPARGEDPPPRHPARKGISKKAPTSRGGEVDAAGRAQRLSETPGSGRPGVVALGGADARRPG